MKKVFALVLVFAAVVVWADVPGVSRAKVIGHGWDLLATSPEEILENAEAFDATGLDGVSVVLCAPDGKGGRYSSLSAPLAKWPKGVFDGALPTLRQYAAHRGLRESLIIANFMPAKRIAWDDDAAWRNFAGNIATLAAISRQAGFKGLMLDNEDYPKIRQWYYDAAKDVGGYEATCDLAKRRGGEVGRAVFAAHPTAALLFYWALTERQDYYRKDGDPSVEKRTSGHLWPAFLEGLVRTMPPEGKIVDGNEDAYFCDAESCDFYKRAWVQHQGLRALLSPEGWSAYQAHQSVSFGIYLDMYVNSKESGGCWYFGPGKDGSRLSRLAANVDQAVRAAGDYVWVYGEQHAFINWRADAPHAGMAKNKRFAKVREEGKLRWEDVLPGFATALRAVTDPVAVAEAALAEDAKSGGKGNLIATGRWLDWQFESKRQTKGVFFKEKADIPHEQAGVTLVGSNVTQGCYYMLLPVKPGQRYAISGWCKGKGGISVSWRQGDRQDYGSRNFSLVFDGAAKPDWQYKSTAFTVQAGADKMQVSCGFGHKNGKGEISKFSDIRVVEIR